MLLSTIFSQIISISYAKALCWAGLSLTLHPGNFFLDVLMTADFFQDFFQEDHQCQTV